LQINNAAAAAAAAAAHYKMDNSSNSRRAVKKQQSSFPPTQLFSAALQISFASAFSSIYGRFHLVRDKMKI